MNLFNPYAHAGMTAPGGDDRRGGGLGMLARRLMPQHFQTGGGGQQMPTPQPMTGGPGQMAGGFHPMTGGPGQQMGGFPGMTGGPGQMSGGPPRASSYPNHLLPAFDAEPHQPNPFARFGMYR